MFSSFSDAALSAFRLWVSWIAVGGSGIGVVCAVLTVLSTREATRRSGVRADAVEAKLGEAENKLAKSEQETKEAYRIAQEARIAGLSRELSPEQRILLTTSLAGVPKGRVLVKGDLTDTEAGSYAKQIELLLREVGVEVIEQGYTGLISLGTPGVSLLVNDDKAPPPHAEPIINCFTAAGIKMQGRVVESAEFPKDVVLIWVSRKQ